MIESPGDLTKNDIADDLELPLGVMLGSRNDFIVYQKYSICDVRSQLQRSDVTYEQLFLLLYSTGKTVYDAESNLLAIAKFFCLYTLLSFR